MNSIITKYLRHPDRVSAEILQDGFKPGIDCNAQDLAFHFSKKTKQKNMSSPSYHEDTHGGKAGRMSGPYLAYPCIIYMYLL